MDHAGRLGKMIDLNDVDTLPAFDVGDQFTMNDTLYTVERVFGNIAGWTQKAYVVSSEWQGDTLYQFAGDLSGDWQGCAHCDLSIEEAMAGEILRIEKFVECNYNRPIGGERA